MSNAFPPSDNEEKLSVKLTPLGFQWHADGKYAINAAIVLACLLLIGFVIWRMT